MGKSRRLRDCVVWAIIIGGHALLILVFTSGKRHVSPLSVEAPSPGVLIFLEETQPSSGATPEPVLPAPTLASVAVPTLPLALPEIDSEGAAITLPETEQKALGSNAIDWQREAERSAQSTAEKSTGRGPKRIGEHPPSPFREKAKPKEFPWDTEASKGVLAQGLIAYVHITQRCIVGVGIAGPLFGCGLGKLPAANGHLFDGMKDPNRQRSSVPDIDTSSALDPPLD